ncbi:GMC family oxidoreductase N-terminal domain-containing protein [Edwardsiella piscicida]|uniref:GMC family oxidoreductase N-terminal domain-containing protein n=1 Tax=Edwardsiella piscicida TaxID=1263550 RepID=UPI0009352235|nr:GMC family oxidoreductase N-terminal domain-containing protein [Edwardsiella piscicida]UCQ19862.1 GMC family oxidoreductase N-terminal domain-containing protein [Edwardsiella piscicida]WAM43358.1 GMC family oxidoreductase N-terminal domain-containing protein [Edwardsiella piscicida]
MKKEYFDAIVIGTGPGGAAASLELSRRGMKVLVLERGGVNQSSGSLLSFMAKAAIPRKHVFLTHDWLVILRALTLGGSGFINYATAKAPPFDLFQRHRIDLTSAFSSVQRELPIAKLSSDLIGPRAGLIYDAAASLGIPFEPLDKMIFQSSCRRGCDLCTYGCPYQAKWHPGLWVALACEQGAQLKADAFVSHILHKNNQAYGVAFRQRGVESFAYAPKIIVAAGGIGTPVILRKSGLDEVGDRLFIDPVIAVMGVVNTPVVSKKEIAMVYGHYNHDAGYTLSDLALPSALQHLFSSLVGKIANPAKTLSIMVKARDNMSGCINAKGLPEKVMTDDDFVRLNSGCQQAESILRAAGAHKLFRTRPFAAHPGGTVALGTHLDTDLQTRLSGLYVCDASAIPEPWGIPPTLTLLTLGRYMAGRLCAERSTVIDGVTR